MGNEVHEGTISQTIFECRIEVPVRWRFATISDWDSLRRRSVGRYCIRVE
jgi:hypothetical protein